jgi:hypothetical protein
MAMKWIGGNRNKRLRQFGLQTNSIAAEGDAELAG